VAVAIVVACGTFQTLLISAIFQWIFQWIFHDVQLCHAIRNHGHRQESLSRDGHDGQDFECHLVPLAMGWLN